MALRELQQPPCPEQQVREDREFVIKKLGLSADEFDRILMAPRRSYKDYPSNRVVFERLGFLVRFAKRVAVGH